MNKKYEESHMGLGKNHNLSAAGAIVLSLGLMMPYSNCSDVSFGTKEKNSNERPPCDDCGTNGPTDVDPRDVTTSVKVFDVANKVDVFLVIDNSGSMVNDHLNLAPRLNGFVQGLESRGLDWQMCYTLTDINPPTQDEIELKIRSDSSGGTALPWKRNIGSVSVPDGNRTMRCPTSDSTGFTVLKPGLAGVDLPTVFNDSLRSIGPCGDGSEQGIRQMYNGVVNSKNAGCFRPDASKAFVVLSDEDEKSCGGRCKTEADEGSVAHPLPHYTNQYRGGLEAANKVSSLMARLLERFGQLPVTVHSLAIRPTLYHNSVLVSTKDRACYDAQDKVAPAFYGVEYARLAAETGGIIGDICAQDASYTQQLTDIAEQIQNSLDSVSLECSPLRGEVNFVPSQNRNYEISGNKLIFNPPLPAGTEFFVKYQCPGE